MNKSHSCKQIASIEPIKARKTKKESAFTSTSLTQKLFLSLICLCCCLFLAFGNARFSYQRADALQSDQNSSESLSAAQIDLNELTCSLLQTQSISYTGWQEGDWYHLYIKENGTNQRTVAYCYNPGVDAPSSSGTSYTANGSVEDTRIRAFMYNAYPIDGGNLMDTFGLSVERFRYISQRALWNIRGESTLTAYGSLRALKTQAEKLCYDLLRGGETTISYNGQAVSLADTPDDFTVNLYTTGNSSYTQDLITAEYETSPNNLIEWPVYFSKTDSDSFMLKGASIELRNSDDSVVASWTSDGESVYVFNVPSDSYKLVETNAPEAYKIAAPINFTLAEDGSISIDSLGTENADADDNTESTAGAIDSTDANDSTNAEHAEKVTDAYSMTQTQAGESADNPLVMIDEKDTPTETTSTETPEDSPDDTPNSDTGDSPDNDKTDASESPNTDKAIATNAATDTLPNTGDALFEWCICILVALACTAFTGGIVAFIRALQNKGCK